VSGLCVDLMIGWNPKIIKGTNYWCFIAGLDIDVLTKELEMELLVLNIYGPYLERIGF